MGKRLTLEEILERFKKAHGDRYSYELIKDFHNQNEKLPIICKEHGIFYQSADKHFHRKQGCPLCDKSHKMNTEEFVERAKKVHSGKYSYPDEYVNSEQKMRIICPIHGEFSQATNDHLHGQGCPHCKQSKIEKIVFDTLTESNITFETQYKYDESNHKNRLDFFIPSMGIGIECQGEQHFKPVDFANKGDEWANELFEKNLVRDKYKRELCENKGIKLLYYVPKKNTVPGYKSNKKFDGLYTNDNVCNNMEQLKKKIEGVSFDDI